MYHTNGHRGHVRQTIDFKGFSQVPANTGSDTVEVTELFSYACSHCNTMEPYVQSWTQSKPDNVVFNRIAVAFGRKAWETMARAYITAEMLGIVEETHPAMMDAIWKEGKQFRKLEDLADFYSGFGVEKSAFLANYESFAADSQLRRSQRDVQLFGITGTPSLVVNRKYRVQSNKDVKDYNAMLDIVDYLVVKETASP